MTNGVIAAIAAVSVSVWIYGKFMKTSGNNTKSALIASVVSGLFLFFVAYTLLGLIPA